MGDDIRVELSEFDKDPEQWMRQASTERRVFVYHDGMQKLFACFGGSLNTLPTDGDRTLTDEDLATLRAILREELGKTFQALGDRLCARIDAIIESGLRGKAEPIRGLRLIEAKGRILQILIKPADDVPGQWVGHCLDLDIVSAGTSFSHALEMVSEAVRECVADDLANGLDPWTRRPAPPELWP